MKYIDLHCDALTNEGVLQVTRESLSAGGCRLQCFAAFVDAKKYGAGRFARALSLCDKFDRMCRRKKYRPVRRFSDIGEGAICAMLTLEEGGATEGSLEKLEELYLRGVRMMSLTWNYENELGYPGLRADGSREMAGGAKAFGRLAVERMGELGMLVDVSHGSDRLVEDVADVLHGTPFVASHSGAAAVLPHPRNLRDREIKRIADSGGAIGLDLCAAFLSDETSFEGQRSAFLAHARHILNVGGEEVLALGSDFDGITPNPYIGTPADMPLLLEDLERTFGTRIAEGIAYRNALRVLRVLR